MKNLIILLICLMYIGVGNAQEFGGDWSFVSGETPPEYVFSLIIYPEKNGITKGEYIFTWYFGNRIDEGNVRMISKKGNKAVLRISTVSHSGPLSKLFNIELLTDSTLYFTRRKHDDYWLPDSVVLERSRKVDEIEL
ncbi:hypothetical protein [Coprobacter tertius]|uniref:DUF4488 domain-containing protein n=1 Tax=Coprobacter tertius TaxID=2944915 RepID=A0ABT1MJ58_9BACT|nr:hypothetical protein [Coprobacter tertius]MCP9612451.1 hypothetical protein [Coprobacter tertius]